MYMAGGELRLFGKKKLFAFRTGEWILNHIEILDFCKNYKYFIVKNTENVLY